MNRIIMKEIQDFLDLIHRNPNKDVYLFGAGKYGLVMKQFLETKGITVKGFIVSDSEYQNTLNSVMETGKKLYKASRFKAERAAENSIVICASVMDMVKSSIVRYGIKSTMFSNATLQFIKRELEGDETYKIEQSLIMSVIGLMKENMMPIDIPKLDWGEGEVVRTREEYLQKRKEITRVYGAYEKMLGELCYLSNEKSICISGFCSHCCEQVDFWLDLLRTTLEARTSRQVNWRERMECPQCRLNNRQRMMFKKIRSEYKPGMKVYITEQITDMYRKLKNVIPDITGSEYLEKDSELKLEESIRNEDLMHLSFDDEMFDMVITQDVLEHISDFRQAFLEINRVLKKGGKTIFTVPFCTESDTTIIRAIEHEEEIEYLLEPAYHENPLSKEGSLVYNDFGWDMFSFLREAGFRDVKMVVYYSIKEGHLGILQFYFEAIK